MIIVTALTDYPQGRYCLDFIAYVPDTGSSPHHFIDLFKYSYSLVELISIFFVPGAGKMVKIIIDDYLRFGFYHGVTLFQS